MENWLQHLLEWLALPQFGLGTVFIVSFISATLLPLGSEPAVFGLIKLNADLYWPAILVATVGNTLGGGVSWWMGLGAHKAVDRARGNTTEVQALRWLERFGPRACLQPVVQQQDLGVMSAIPQAPAAPAADASVPQAPAQQGDQAVPAAPPAQPAADAEIPAPAPQNEQ